MNPITLTPGAARRALGACVEPADDTDAVGAYARAVWSVLTEPGDRVAGELILALGPADALDAMLYGSGVPAAARAAGLGAAELAAGRARWMPRRGGVEASLEVARRAGVQLLTPEDADWPRRAEVLGPCAPICLWVRGDARVLTDPAPAVALVGARASSAYGEHVASELAAESALSGISVYSGGAYGIDAAAHRATLTAGGTTVALMAGGLERVYPVGNQSLIDDIARRGAVVAEVPCGTVPTKFRFLARNRLIAALSDGTVVVEAGWRSGAINTANHAQDLGRPLGVVPGPITSASSMGCHRLLRESEAVCITGMADVRELLGVAGAAGPESLFDAGPYTDQRTRILDAMSTRSARSTGDIARRGGFDPDEAAALLGMLELDGAVHRGAAGWSRVAGNDRGTGR